MSRASTARRNRSIIVWERSSNSSVSVKRRSGAGCAGADEKRLCVRAGFRPSPGARRMFGRVTIPVCDIAMAANES